MLDEATIEERLVNLERTVAIQNRLSAIPSSNNWLDEVAGSISDEQAFLEVLEYGKLERYADKPVDSSNEQA
ncbi:transferase hexapeptide repeat containing protein [Rivularia sp. UHCC 0363]|uniref:transferase hexapeptide repeat containing protein n=1 Tax=Rivularia sp. UHCC 0363 TaxID=3110244 RepID=UPI002B1F5D33|nr:transferase hexapeptide repeat containing protein [Rivularia sp. UHCC 0363]MEA5599217.1 transferase hexapeptide repeat containing protein [Rivularia sp. UHCC 0363]